MKIRRDKEGIEKGLKLKVTDNKRSFTNKFGSSSVKKAP